MHIKLIVLVFITFAVLAVTAFNERRLGGCECSGRPHFTRRCCERHGGVYRSDRCHYQADRGFLRCCEREGLRGTCFT